MVDVPVWETLEEAVLEAATGVALQSFWGFTLSTWFFRARTQNLYLGYQCSGRVIRGSRRQR